MTNDHRPGFGHEILQPSLFSENEVNLRYSCYDFDFLGEDQTLVNNCPELNAVEFVFADKMKNPGIIEETKTFY